MVKYGLNRVQLPLWLEQSLINGVSWYGFVLGQSGQRTSVKYAEVKLNSKVWGHSTLKITFFSSSFLFLIYIYMWICHPNGLFFT